MAKRPRRKQGGWGIRENKLKERYIKRKGTGKNIIRAKDLEQLWAKYKKSCAYCQRPLDKIQWDHIIPIRRGGDNSKANMVPCCLSCNGIKEKLMDKDDTLPLKIYTVENIRKLIL